jgi:glyoxylase-like metal-dependent hydrolase (beta-lactamase superfamily II)
VAADLWVWQVYDPRVKADLSSSLIRTAHGLVAVDPVDLVEHELVAVSRLGPVAAIVLTNGNHGRASARFRQRFGAPVLAHPDAVGELELPVDGTLRPGNLVGGSLDFIELPGAGPGEVALWDARGRLHFGDALIHLQSTGFSTLPAKYCENAGRLQQSLQRLRSLPVEILTFAHGLPVVMQARARLDALLDSLGSA